MAVTMKPAGPAGRAAAASGRSAGRLPGRAPGRMTGVERRGQLLDVARSIVTQGGFGAVSMEAVARAAGVTRPVVYEHFDRLENLLEALIDRESERALEQLTASRPQRTPGGDPRHDLLDALRAYLEAVASAPETWRLVLLPSDGAPERLRAFIAAGRAWNLGRLTELVAPGITPDTASPDAELTARLLVTVSEEFARLMLTNPTEYPVERLLGQARWILGLLGPTTTGAVP